MEGYGIQSKGYCRSANTPAKYKLLKGVDPGFARLLPVNCGYHLHWGHPLIGSVQYCIPKALQRNSIDIDARWGTC